MEPVLGTLQHERIGCSTFNFKSLISDYRAQLSSKTLLPFTEQEPSHYDKSLKMNTNSHQEIKQDGTVV